ncbi:hypothetical protein SFC81_19625, partial [Enterococcus faecalis]
ERQTIENVREESKMKQEIIRFVEKFIKRMKRQKRAFCMADIERAYDKEQKKQGKKSVKWTNMSRLLIVSKLLKMSEVNRTYRKRADGMIYPIFNFKQENL